MVPRQTATLADDETAEAAALADAVTRARMDKRSVSHAEMRAWLLRIANGEPTAPPPTPRPE